MYKLLFFLLLALVACKSKLNSQIETTKTFEKELVTNQLEVEVLGIKTHSGDLPYQQLRNTIQKERKELQELFRANSITLDSVQQYFEEQLLNGIIPYWYGTAWSFEGHTNVPNQGEIACGYFVSTTLVHMGLDINRYRMAQKSPIDEAKYLDKDGEPITISTTTTEEAIQQIKEKGYADKFQHQNKIVKLLGINFSSKTKMVEKWLSEVV